MSANYAQEHHDNVVEYARRLVGLTSPDKADEELEASQRRELLTEAAEQ